MSAVNLRSGLEGDLKLYLKSYNFYSAGICCCIKHKEFLSLLLSVDFVSQLNFITKRIKIYILAFLSSYLL
jgi:hypothetical protein